MEVLHKSRVSSPRGAPSPFSSVPNLSIFAINFWCPSLSLFLLLLVFLLYICSAILSMVPWPGLFWWSWFVTSFHFFIAHFSSSSSYPNRIFLIHEVSASLTFRLRLHFWSLCFSDSDLLEMLDQKFRWRNQENSFFETKTNDQDHPMDSKNQMEHCQKRSFYGVCSENITQWR